MYELCLINMNILLLLTLKFKITALRSYNEYICLILQSISLNAIAQIYSTCDVMKSNNVFLQA